MTLRPPGHACLLPDRALTPTAPRTFCELAWPRGALCPHCLWQSGSGTVQPDEVWRWCRLASPAGCHGTGLGVTRALTSPEGKTGSSRPLASSLHSGFEPLVVVGNAHIYQHKLGSSVPHPPGGLGSAPRAHGPGCDQSGGGGGVGLQCPTQELSVLSQLTPGQPGQLAPRQHAPPGRAPREDEALKAGGCGSRRPPPCGLCFRSPRELLAAPPAGGGLPLLPQPLRQLAGHPPAGHLPAGHQRAAHEPADRHVQVA